MYICMSAKTMSLTTLHKINCVTACIASCYTIYNILCNVVRLALSCLTSSRRALRKLLQAAISILGQATFGGFAAFFGLSVILFRREMSLPHEGCSDFRAICPRPEYTPKTRCFCLAFNFPACC